MKTLEERFNEKWVPVPESGCWIWTAGLNSKGYGTVRDGQTLKMTHRVSYELHVGQIPDGMHVLHKCDTPACVNPAHLFLGTHADNMTDKVSKCRQSKGETHNTAKLTAAQVREIRFAYATRQMTQQALADKYGVSRSLVGKIVNHKIWRN